MKKAYFLICTFATALLFTWGCTRENLGGQNGQDGGLVIRITCPDFPTKTVAGTDEENRVTKLEILVYENASAATPFISRSINVDSANQLDGTYEQTLSFASDFSSDAEKVKNAVVFAVANYTGTLPTNQPLADVKALTLDENTSATFLSRTGTGTPGDPYVYNVAATPTFVMTAQGSFTKGVGNEAIANLPLKRKAAKLTLEVSFPATITTTGTDTFFGDGSTPIATTTTWTPMTSGKNVRTYLVNARSNAVLGESYPGTNSLFTYEENLITGSVSNAFYSYPIDLSAVSGTEEEPYIKLIQPWRYETTIEQDGHNVLVDQNIVELYYKIMMPSSLSSLDANTFYRLNAELSVLGGEASRPMVIMAEGISILDWGNVIGSGAVGDQLGMGTFTEASFVLLPVDGAIIQQPDPTKIEYNITVEKGETFSFPFYATEEVEMTINEISFTKLTNGPETGGKPNNIDTDDGAVTKILVTDGAKGADFDSEKKTSWEPDKPWTTWVTLQNATNNKGGTVSLNHSMDISYSSDDFAITPYVYQITLALKTKPTTKAVVTITQNPLIRVSQNLSHANVFVNGSKYGDGSNTQTFQTVFASNAVYQYNGTPPTSGTFYSTSNNPVNTPAEYNSFLGVIPKPAQLKNVASTKYRFVFNVEPFSETDLITNPLIDITVSSDLGMILTKSGTGGGTGTLPITDSYHATNSAYVGNNTDNCIVKSSKTGTSGANNRNSTTYVNGINYKAPSLETSSRRFVAPKFIVASSFGMSGGYLSFGQAFLRCATYQEDGYPAGRWRLPTEAEIQYVYSLVSRGYLPALFNGKYWASSGRLYSRSTDSFTGTTTDAGTARCVYDLWYWDDGTVTETTYTVKTTK